MPSLGLSVSAAFLVGPLSKLSPRALRLWCLLVASADHPTKNFTMVNGQRVQVSRGQFLTSSRKLARLAGCSLASVSIDLAALVAADLITTTPVSPSSTPLYRSAVHPRAAEQYRGKPLATLISVNETGLSPGGGCTAQRYKRSNTRTNQSRSRG